MDEEPRRVVGVMPPGFAFSAAVAGFLAAVGLAACYLPARRAMAVDPREALTPE